jgi:hypothetical protein
MRNDELGMKNRERVLSAELKKGRGKQYPHGLSAVQVDTES